MLRDRRTIVTLVAMPLLLYPLLSVAFLQFAFLGKADADRGAKYVLGFASNIEAEVFFLRMARGATAQGAAARGGTAPELDVRIGTPDELDAKLRSGGLDLVVRVPKAERVAAGAANKAIDLKGRDWRFNCELIFLAGSPGGQGRWRSSNGS